MTSNWKRLHMCSACSIIGKNVILIESAKNHSLYLVQSTVFVHIHGCVNLPASPGVCKYAHSMKGTI